MVPKSETDRIQDHFSNLFGSSKPTTWEQIESIRRCVILAGAGAGKTHEMLSRAKAALADGRFSFFIRIEDIVEGFEDAFEVGSSTEFQRWLASSSEAWFFLDSIDEARISHPRAFEKSVRRFSKKIKGAEHRSFVFISGRPYAWQAIGDLAMLNRLLPYSEVNIADDAAVEFDLDEVIDIVEEEPESATKVYLLCDLDETDIRTFAQHHAAPDIDQLISELYRSNLIELASRPYDLIGIVAKWSADRKLGSRSEFLRYAISEQLKEIDPLRAQRRPLSPEKALEGARLLAAAVVLSGEPGLQVPDSVHPELRVSGLSADRLLSDWNAQDIQTLLERGLFSDVLYGLVRFRHRDVREFLAAEWFANHLQNGNARYAVEALIFREQYGEQTLSPRLRPALPWLILLDAEVRRRALTIAPEVAVEGGDPSQLPVVERRAILQDIVRRIVHEEDDRSARDNEAIARIAQIDLTDVALHLIDKHADHDDALFFLGRLVWQGRMVDCLPALFHIAVDPNRGIWARVAASRAVMTLGARDLQDALWDSVLALTGELSRRLLVELVQDAWPDAATVGRVLASIEKLPPYDRFEATGFTSALRGLIDRLDDMDAVAHLTEGIINFLGRPPFIERRECRISQSNAWLLGSAAHAVERLIQNRSAHAFGAAALDVMLKLPAARFWGNSELNDDKTKLQDLVPAWPELNDALFWANVANVRAHKLENGESLIDDWALQWPEHFWQFDADCLSRVIGFASERPEQDDRLVALSLAVRIIRSFDLSPEKLAELRASIEADPVAIKSLDEQINRPITKESKAFAAREAERKLKQDRKALVQAEERRRWIAEMQADPDRIRSPKNISPSEMSGDQFHLREAVKQAKDESSRYGSRNWKSLIPEFGEAVANAYRDAAVAQWRAYNPPLPSEGHEGNGTPYCLIFGLSGLEIESHEVEGFAERLTEDEVRHAMRYATWELNGFPTWIEAMHKAWPEIVQASILAELWWEFDRATGDEIGRILHDLTYHAPWFHTTLAGPIIEWLFQNPLPGSTALRYCVQIIRGGGVANEAIVALAQKGIDENLDNARRATLQAIWLDADAETGIASLEAWLAGLPPDEAGEAAQGFVTALIGTRRFSQMGQGYESYRTPALLMRLYVLMHRYIRVADDIERAGKGCYSPGLRDDAQDARNALFNMLSEIPGKETYFALKSLTQNHPNAKARSWMGTLARKRAETDSDLQAWTANQIHEFDRYQAITPTTNRQLFDLTVSRLLEMRNWLETGDDSPYQNWQRAENESEMRTLITGYLNLKSGNRYVCAQENELANAQRPDIWTQSPAAPNPVPIELKLLDKNWSGPSLCERLCNQLAGDYLRHGDSRSGVFLLVWRGQAAAKSWQINGESVELNELENALRKYWLTISRDFPHVDGIEVLVVDLTKRNFKAAKA
jgi:hypothetical protein